MSTLLEQASLVLIPSGYKEDVVYSQIPTNGSGDLSFTRASNGTRVNSAGLVEVVAWNLMQYSNTFSNGVWVTGGYGNLPTLTANSIANPVNGLTDAWTASFAAAGTQGRLLQLFTGLPIGVPYTFSMYIKAGTKTSVAIYSDTATVGLNAIFNLSNGTISSTSGTTATITAMTNGWYYVTITNNILSSGNGQYGIVTNTGEDGTLYIYGAQLNIGSTAKPYFPTTDRLNVPRLTYQNGGGGCPSLLLEKQSTNLLTYSEDFNSWLNAGGTVTTNTAISPDGTQNADTLTGARYQSGLGTGVFTFSCYAKKVDGNNKFNLRFDVVGSDISTFDLNLGVIDSVASGYTATITNVGNGWYRCTMTSNASIIIANVVIVSANGGSNSTYVWGAQLEASSYATSYISTTSASATRVADACFNTSATALIGQTEGTILLDCEILTTDTQDLLSIRPGGTSSLAIGTASNLILGYVIEGATVISMSFANYAINTRYKIALAYKNGECALYVNGTQSDIDTTAFTFSTALSSLYLGQSQYFGKSSYENNEVVLFKTRLTNAELASLTTI